MMFTLLEYTMSVHFVGDDSQLNAIKSLQFSQKCKAPMKTPRRYAPMGGRLQVEWVATFSGLCRLTDKYRRNKE